jgi:hypothetical protein
MPLILFDRASSYYELTTALVREAGVRPRGTIELDNIEAAKRMVAGGLGVALLPRTSVADELAAGTFAASRIAGTDPQPRHIGVLRRADAGGPSPTLAAFLELAQRVPEIVPGAVRPATIDEVNTAPKGKRHGRQGTRQQGRRQEAEDIDQEAEGRRDQVADAAK